MKFCMGGPLSVNNRPYIGCYHKMTYWVLPESVSLQVASFALGTAFDAIEL